MKPFIARSPAIVGLMGVAILALAAASISTTSAAITRPGVVPVHQVHAVGVRPNDCGTMMETINTGGGKFKVPPCNGTKGKVTYGPNNAPAGSSVTLSSSVTNPAPSICGSAAGETTLAYVTATGNGAGSVTYQNTNKKSTLKNAAFQPSMTFSLYAYAFGVEQFHQSLGSPNAHHVLKFTSPLNGKTIPLGITLCFELDTP